MKKKPSEPGSSTYFVTKASSAHERYAEDKLAISLERAGAPPEVLRKILKQIRARLRPGMSTHDIHQAAFAILKKESSSTAARYGLRRSIMRLGPTGFPFERLVAAIFEIQGFDTSVGVTLKGKCVDHEVDVLAFRGSERSLVECKFRNQAGRKCDIKVPLYVYARSLDLRNRGDRPSDHDFWLVTNTKFSSEAIQYGECVGLKLMSWDYPAGQGLKDLIEENGLHPVTCITRFKSSQLDTLLAKGILLCSDILADPGSLRSLGLRENEQRRILNEIMELLPVTAGTHGDDDGRG